MTTTGPTARPSRDLARVVERNITALLAREQQEADRRSRPTRIADAVTHFTGSITFVVMHLVVYGSWIAVNSGLLPFHRFDPTFVILATEASVEAIFLSTFVLISQNRMQGEADLRAKLDLQVSLLAEHEITRLISLVQAMAAKMGLEEALDPELEELARDVAPERVLDEMEQIDARATRKL